MKTKTLWLYLFLWGMLIAGCASPIASQEGLIAEAPIATHLTANSETSLMNPTLAPTNTPTAMTNAPDSVTPTPTQNQMILPVETSTSTPSPHPPTTTPVTTFAPQPYALDFHTIAQHSDSYYDGLGDPNPEIIEPTILLLQNQDELEDFWIRHNSGRSPLPPLPVIDFETEQVIVLIDNLEFTGGYQVTILQLEVTEAGLTVYAEKISPGSTCLVGGAMTQPFHIIKTERNQQPLTLSLVRLTHECPSF